MRGILSRRRLLEAAGAIAAPAVVSSPAAAAQFQFKCAGESGPTHPHSIRLRQMWNAVERESGGRIATQFFPNNQLGSPGAVFGQLRIGAIEFQHVTSAVISSLAPVFDILLLGFVFANDEDAARACDGALGAHLRSEAAAKGLFVFPAVWNAGMYQIGTVPRAVKIPEDLGGLKIRVAESKVTVGLFKELGATPTPLGFSEVYGGLQSRIIDGEAAPLDSIVASRFFEVNKYISLTNHAWASEWLLASPDVWRSLPADLQALVARNARKYAFLERRDIEIGSESIADKLSRQGLVLNGVDQAPFRRKLGSYYQSWAGVFGAAAWGLLEGAAGRKLS